MRLLRQECRPQDVWLFNATQVALDMLTGMEVAVQWIPRDENSVCDALARKAVTNGCIELAVAPEFEVAHLRGWRNICIEFVKRFDMSPLYPQRVSCVVRPWSF